MKRIFWLIVGVGLGSVCMWTSMSYHVLRTRDGVACVPKYRAQLAGTFIDVREWGVTEWTEHPELVMMLEQHQRTEIIGDAKVLGTTIREAMNFAK